MHVYRLSQVSSSSNCSSETRSVSLCVQLSAAIQMFAITVGCVRVSCCIVASIIMGTENVVDSHAEKSKILSLV